MAWEDLFVYGVFLFGFAILIAITYAVVGNIFPSVSYFTNNYTVNGTTVSPLTFSNNILGMYNWMFLVFTVILAIALFLSAYFLPSHPAFAVVGFIMSLIWVWFSPNLSNTWITIMQLPIMAGFEAHFPFITSFIVNLPAEGFFVGIVAMIIFYGKPNQAQTGIG